MLGCEIEVESEVVSQFSHDNDTENKQKQPLLSQSASHFHKLVAKDSKSFVSLAEYLNYIVLSSESHSVVLSGVHQSVNVMYEAGFGATAYRSWPPPRSK